MTDEKDKRSLGIDWDAAFPGHEIKVAGVSIILKPMGAELLASVIKRLKSIGTELASAGVTKDNYRTAEGLPALASVVLAECPTIVSDASNIKLADIKRLPVEELVVLIGGILEVNLKSREVLEKNLQNLAGTLEKMVAGVGGKDSGDSAT